MKTLTSISWLRRNPRLGQSRRESSPCLAEAGPSGCTVSSPKAISNSPGIRWRNPTAR